MTVASRTVSSVSRLFVAAYLAALIAGPAPFGISGMLSKKLHAPSAIAIPLFLAMILVIPWLIAGFVAGRRLGSVAATLGFLLMEWHFIAETFVRDIPWYNRPFAVVMLIAVMLIPAAVAALGAFISRHWRLSKMLNDWRYWPVPAVILALILGYTIILGPSVALHTLRGKFAKEWPKDSSKIKAYTAGVYPAVDGITGCTGCGFPDTYYTDPTGLVFLYKCNLD